MRSKGVVVGEDGDDGVVAAADVVVVVVVVVGDDDAFDDDAVIDDFGFGVVDVVPLTTAAVNFLSKTAFCNVSSSLSA